MVGSKESLDKRWRTANPSSVIETIARMTSAVCAAVCRVTGSNKVLPMRARPVDNDSYCGSKDSPVHHGNQGERGTVLDAEFVERLGDVEPYTVGLVQFVSDAGLQPGEPPPLEFVVK